MASIFTYDPDPPKVSSPWLIPGYPTPETKCNGSVDAHGSLLSDYGVTKLEAEPQEGPTEYKLHLLLRPRRAYRAMTTVGRAARIQPAESQTQLQPQESIAQSGSSTPSTTSSQTRQQRLLHLTTQLLWRLQQSSPYHASSSKEITLPRLPSDSVHLDTERELEPLVPGLEESRGALYEIGVSDDGTLVGLTKDEMDESIKTLRIMASSLGCLVEVTRTVIVGDCEWIEYEDTTKPAASAITKSSKLWVAEALVTPNLKFSAGCFNTLDANSSTGLMHLEKTAIPNVGSSLTPQLRVTFTGPTTSGKSSLLGTLSTGTLDNGRGKSRLSLLRHQHELVSGVTSSIAQELIGYKNQEILNFALGNIESWIDIHDCAQDGRMVFVSDSGGHPRYRRTILRGLMNWAPHWSILCIGADDGDAACGSPGVTSTAEQVLGSVAASVDLVKAHLSLLLKLEVPMAVVVTKLDLATKTSLQKVMSKILSAIKDAGRTPKILQPDQKQLGELKHIPSDDYAKVQGLVKTMDDSGDLTQIVPIILTSSVKGTGIGLLHALLEGLPLPPSPSARDFVGNALDPEQPKSLFHVDDTFNLVISNTTLAGGSKPDVDRGVVVSGYLRFGSLSVGDELVVGPFPPEDDDARLFAEDKASPGSYGLSISHPSSAELAKIAMKNAVSASTTPGEWHQAQIVSIRNLRLPVRRLESGQAGSIGLVLKAGKGEGDEAGNSTTQRIRRGMVLAVPSKHMIDSGLSLQAASGFTATFSDVDMVDLAVGSFVNVYVASIRASARVRGISRHGSSSSDEAGGVATDQMMFSLNGEEETDDSNGGVRKPCSVEVFLELLHNREWIELGSRVMLLEGGRQDRSGIEGIVGKIIEIVD